MIVTESLASVDAEKVGVDEVDEVVGRHWERAVARSGWELVAAVQRVREKGCAKRRCEAAATALVLVMAAAAAERRVGPAKAAVHERCMTREAFGPGA